MDHSQKIICLIDFKHIVYARNLLQKGNEKYFSMFLGRSGEKNKQLICRKINI